MYVCICIERPQNQIDLEIHSISRVNIISEFSTQTHTNPDRDTNETGISLFLYLNLTFAENRFESKQPQKRHSTHRRRRSTLCEYIHLPMRDVFFFFSSCFWSFLNSPLSTPFALIYTLAPSLSLSLLDSLFDLARLPHNNNKLQHSSHSNT